MTAGSTGQELLLSAMTRQCSASLTAERLPDSTAPYWEAIHTRSKSTTQAPPPHTLPTFCLQCWSTGVSTETILVPVVMATTSLPADEDGPSDEWLLGRSGGRRPDLAFLSALGASSLVVPAGIAHWTEDTQRVALYRQPPEPTSVKAHQCHRRAPNSLYYSITLFIITSHNATSLQSIQPVTIQTT